MTPLIHTTDPSQLKIATPADSRFVADLQRKHSDALGFLPRVAIDTYVASGRVLIGRENDDHAGYILGRNSLRYDRRIAPITQAAVCMDARRRHLGLALVEAWCSAAYQDGRSCVQCWCADDLESATFWPAVGFTAIARRWPQNSRRRSLTLWRRPIRSADLDPTFRVLPPLAGHRASKVGRIELLVGGGSAVMRPDDQYLIFDLLTDDCESHVRPT
jgi:hypothetical protein